MIFPLTDLNSWPLDLVGHPIFKTTNEALLYAQLIYDSETKQQRLLYYRRIAHAELKRERENEHPNFDRMMELAVTAQFYRESFEECKRIKDEKFNTTRR